MKLKRWRLIPEGCDVYLGVLLIIIILINNVFLVYVWIVAPFAVGLLFSGASLTLSGLSIAFILFLGRPEIEE